MRGMRSDGENISSSWLSTWNFANFVYLSDVKYNCTASGCLLRHEQLLYLIELYFCWLTAILVA